MFCIWYLVSIDLAVIAQGEEQIQHKTLNPHKFDSFEFVKFSFQ